MNFFAKKLTTLLLLSIFGFSVHTHLNAETLRIASGEYPPWTSQSLPGGGYINLVVSEAFKLHGINVEFDYLPWKRALEATRVGKYHATSFWGEDKEREKDFHHSQSIENIYFVFFYRKERFNGPFKWDKLTSLGRLKVGATRGYTYSEEFWRLYEENKLRVAIANDDVESLRKLISGQIDLFPISEFTGKYLLHRNFSKAEIESIEVSPKPLSKGMNFILFSKMFEDNQTYVALLNSGLDTLREQGQLKSLQETMFK